MGSPEQPKTWQEREAEKWRELFSGGDEAEEAEPEGAESSLPSALPPGRWMARFKDRRHPTPVRQGEETRYVVVDRVELAIEDQSITALNDTGTRIKVRSHAYGTDLLVPDGDPGPGDGLPVFTVAEVARLWAQGPPDPELLTTILAVKTALGGELTAATPVDRDIPPTAPTSTCQSDIIDRYLPG
ncbi:MAG: hypothetical protein ACE5IM_10600 [Nitrospinota bacterium]